MNTPIKQSFFNSIAQEFDDHVRKSIPHFGDFIDCLRGEIVKLSYNRFENFTNVLDICGSTGLFGHQLFEEGFKGSYVNLDGSPEMCKISNEFSKEHLFHTTLMEGFMASWEDESGVHIPEFNAKENYRTFDIVIESLGFQFFTQSRIAEVAEVAKLLNYDGIAIFVEKFSNMNQNLWEANEHLKDELWKSKFFTPEEIEAKRKNVLQDMGEYCYDYDEFVSVLCSQFEYVKRIYKAGNFAGYACSNVPFEIDCECFYNEFNA